MSEAERRVNRALELAIGYGQIDGSHHKMWVIDQIVRILAGDGYEELIKQSNAGEDGPRYLQLGYWDSTVAALEREKR